MQILRIPNANAANFHRHYSPRVLNHLRYSHDDSLVRISKSCQAFQRSLSPMTVSCTARIFFWLSTFCKQVINFLAFVPFRTEYNNVPSPDKRALKLLIVKLSLLRASPRAVVRDKKINYALYACRGTMKPSASPMWVADWLQLGELNNP